MAIQNIKLAAKVAAGDVTGLSLIAAVTNKAADYVSAVTATEAHLLAGGALGDEDYIRLDKVRTLSHNALIDAINICNRYLLGKYRDELPATGIFDGPAEVLQKPDRRAIGDWAGELVAEMFATRQ